MMKGIIQGINSRIMRVAVLTDYGYTVFDADDGDFNIGDAVYGDLDNHGDAVLKIESTGETVHVYIEAIQATKQSAESLLRNR
jgi:hypothetical protein